MKSLLFPLTWFGNVSARSAIIDLERLQWLCTDYQLPVAGYVVEGWFQTIHMPGMERFLKEQLKIAVGIHCIKLTDGSVLTTVMERKDKKWEIELQLVATTAGQAAEYYNWWQQFSDKYSPNHPIGVTVVTQLPEALDTDVSKKIMQELAEGLALESHAFIMEDGYQQLSGFTAQLRHKIEVNGIAINTSITIVPETKHTYLYIASPMLYQQI